MASRPSAASCKHFDICGLAAVINHDGQPFCILHYPVAQSKNLMQFGQALEKHLSDGRCDLRYIHFPAGMPNVPLEGRHFTEQVNLSHTTFPGTLSLTNARLDRGFLLEGERVKSLSLQGAQIGGDIRVRLGTLEDRFILDAATCDGSVEVEVSTTVELRAQRAEFRASVAIQAGRIRNLDLNASRFLGGLKLRGTVFDQPYMGVPTRQFSFVNTFFCGEVDCVQCVWEGSVSFLESTFHENTILNLRDSTIRGDLRIAGPAILPRQIQIDGVVVTGDTHITTELGVRPPRVVATAHPPRFHGPAELKNVDASECRLVGNMIHKLELSGIRWHRLFGRWALYDEALFRSGKDVPIADVREAYQVLKESYKARGDHALSGDFHYGEMEMKRRESGRLRDRFGLECWYWLFSGYGTRPLQAFLVLASMILLFGSWYSWLDMWQFEGRILRALRFSLSVATLQRPDMPVGFSELGQWLYRIEAIVCPIQIALFALALRMRLKR